jgi:hypothetical protein
MIVYHLFQAAGTVPIPSSVYAGLAGISGSPTGRRLREVCNHSRNHPTQQQQKCRKPASPSYLPAPLKVKLDSIQRVWKSAWVQQESATLDLDHADRLCSEETNNNNLSPAQRDKR